MATGHWLTNRGKLLLLQGLWDDAGATHVKCGLLATQANQFDTEAEVQDANTVADLLTHCTEITVSGYARQTLTRSAAVEDDTNNRVNMDADDVAFGALGSGETIVGIFFYDATTDTNDTTRLLISVDFFASGVPTNGGTFTYNIADLYRAA